MDGGSAAGLGILLAGCGDRQSTAEDIATPEDTQTDRIVVGFSQVGVESDWRSANTESMKSTFTKEAGYDLIFEDGQQKTRRTRSGPSEPLSSRRWTRSSVRTVTVMGHGAQGSKGCRDPGGHRRP